LVNKRHQYVAKKNMNWLWLDGIPKSPLQAPSGLGSEMNSLSNSFINVFTNIPAKKPIRCSSLTNITKRERERKRIKKIERNPHVLSLVMQR